MKTFTQNRGIVAAVTIFVLVMFMYNLFVKPDDSLLPDETLATSVGDDLVKIFGELQVVTLDQSIFSSTGYLLLTDFSMSIPQQTIGRPNPFNVIGRD